MSTVGGLFSLGMKPGPSVGGGLLRLSLVAASSSTPPIISVDLSARAYRPSLVKGFAGSSLPDIPSASSMEVAHSSQRHVVVAVDGASPAPGQNTLFEKEAFPPLKEASTGG